MVFSLDLEGRIERISRCRADVLRLQTSRTATHGRNQGRCSIPKSCRTGITIRDLPEGRGYIVSKNTPRNSAFRHAVMALLIHTLNLRALSRHSLQVVMPCLRTSSVSIASSNRADSSDRNYTREVHRTSSRRDHTGAVVLVWKSWRRRFASRACPCRSRGTALLALNKTAHTLHGYRGGARDTDEQILYFFQVTPTIRENSSP